MRLSFTNVLLIIVLVVGAAVGSAYLIYAAFSKDSPAMANQEIDEKSGTNPIGPTLSLGTVTVNLADGNQYLRAEIVLELTERHSLQEIEQRMPQVLDRVNEQIRKYSADDLSSPGGDAPLKEDIRKSINPLLSRGQVADVYFTSRVIQ